MIASKFNSNIIALNSKFEDLINEKEINQHYNFVFSCVDSIETRMNINLINYDTLIDLGTEGNKCHIKIVRNDTSCLYCISTLYKNDMIINCAGRSIESLERREDILNYFINENDVIERFNKIARERNLKETNEFEVFGIRNRIIENACFVNSICASVVFILLQKGNEDFCFYNGAGFNIMKIDKKKDCIVCNDKNI